MAHTLTTSSYYYFLAMWLAPCETYKGDNQDMSFDRLWYQVVCMLSRFSHVWLFAIPWTVAQWALLSMGFSREGYWSGLSRPSPGIFLTQGSNLSLLCLLHWQAGSLQSLAGTGLPSLALLYLFLSFIFCPTSFRRQWAAFLGTWCLLLVVRSCFMKFAQCSNALSINL